MVLGLYFGYTNEKEQDVLIGYEKPSPKVDQSIEQADDKKDHSPELNSPDKGLFVLMGKDVRQLKSTLGEPARIEPSAYGYDWWVFNENYDRYVQVGVEDEKVVSVHAIGPEADVEPFKIGQPVEEIFSKNLIQTDITVDYNESSYRFELSEDDMNTRPLVKIGNAFAQIYIDKFTGTLSSVRFIDNTTLIKHRPYEMVYRGNLLEASPLDEVQWKKVEKGVEQQIFDLTNVIRLRHGLDPLKWDEETAQVAYSHSKDMEENDNFSHTSQKYGTLTDRLKTADVFYQLAGENIAANYIDGPSVVEGWLNSKGHRETLLNEEFTHIGVGVYQKHYTQNFIKRWEE